MHGASMRLSGVGHPHQMEGYALGGGLVLHLAGRPGATWLTPRKAYAVVVLSSECYFMAPSVLGF